MCVLLYTNHLGVHTLCLAGARSLNFGKRHFAKLSSQPPGTRPHRWWPAARPPSHLWPESLEASSATSWCPSGPWAMQTRVSGMNLLKMCFEVWYASKTFRHKLLQHDATCPSDCPKPFLTFFDHLSLTQELATTWRVFTTKYKRVSFSSLIFFLNGNCSKMQQVCDAYVLLWPLRMQPDSNKVTEVKTSSLATRLWSIPSLHTRLLCATERVWSLCRSTVAGRGGWGTSGCTSRSSSHGPSGAELQHHGSFWRTAPEGHDSLRSRTRSPHEALASTGSQGAGPPCSWSMCRWTCLLCTWLTRQSPASWVTPLAKKPESLAYGISRLFQSRVATWAMPFYTWEITPKAWIPKQCILQFSTYSGENNFPWYSMKTVENSSPARLQLQVLLAPLKAVGTLAWLARPAPPLSP